MMTRVRDKYHWRQQKAWRFFREHAAYVVGQQALGAWHLVQAEAWAKEEDLEYYWEYDNDPDLSWCDCGHCNEHEVYTCLLIEPCATCGEVNVATWYMRCAQCGTQLRVLDNLSGIVDPTPADRRVIEAELAAEAMHHEKGAA